MHPDIRQLAAYLDGALDETQRAGLRTHILTCASCAARLERLRTDAHRIADALSNGPAPDVRASVRARLHRPDWNLWLARGAALAGGLVGLVVFALLIATGSGATAGRIPDRLFVTDTGKNRLVVLDAATGAQIGATALGDLPSQIAYDPADDMLYVMLRQSVVAIDPRTLQPSARWIAPAAFAPDAGMALDSRRARLYIAQPDGVTALALDAPDLAPARTYALDRAPNALALSPDGARLFALATSQARLWTIDLSSGGTTSLALAPSDAIQYGWLAADDTFVYVLLRSLNALHRLWRIDSEGQPSAPLTLAASPPIWDMELLGSGALAIPRGNGATGGVELIDPRRLVTIARVDPEHDQHHLARGPGGAFFGLNFSHGSVSRYDAAARAVVWRTPEDHGWVPWDGAYVPGGWRWPW